jgi:signal transduction histidine kinase
MPRTFLSLRTDRLFTRPDWRVNRVYWLVLLLITGWVLLHALAPYSSGPAVAPAPFLGILGVAYANLGFRGWARHRLNRGRLSALAYARCGLLFVTVDFSLVALGLRFSGAESSPLWVVFFVLVVAETLLATDAETNAIRRGAALALVVGTLPSPATLGLAPGFHSSYILRLFTSGYAVDTLTRFAFLVAVSSVTRRLRQNQASTDRENAGLRAEIALASERATLSREIHDGVGNSLAAAVLRLEVTARILEKKRAASGDVAPDGTTAHAASVAEDPAMATDAVLVLRDEARALREAMTAVRDWTFFTRPWPAPAVADARSQEIPFLEGELSSSTPIVPDLAPAANVPSPAASQVLASEVDRLGRRTGLPITIEGAEALDSLTAAASRLAVLRITQEALTNAAKYATGASSVTVRMHRDAAAHQFVLSVEDDGPGFDVASAGAGVGLSSMRERTQMRGGTLAIESAPGKGTRITARLPLR